MHHRVNDCLYVLIVYEFAKELNEFVKKENECRFFNECILTVIKVKTDNCFIESIFW